MSSLKSRWWRNEPNVGDELAVGAKVRTPREFTSPIGVHFAAGTVFTVVLGGALAGRSILVEADLPCRSRAWISDGAFLTDDGLVFPWPVQS